MKKNYRNFGIVQGRLTKSRQLQKFPRNWQAEFALIKKTKLNFIELLDERKLNYLNPLTYKGGFKDIDKISKKYKIIKYSICTDYIINNNLFSKNNKKTLEHVERLINLSIKHKYKIFILPLLEASKINKNNWKIAINTLKDISNKIKNSNLILCLETILNANDLIKLLKNINKRNIKCVFDTGNRVLISNSLKNEILKLNKYIGHVHIKDKNKKNKNVILGTGNVNFTEVFEALKKINYNSKFTFETNRGRVPVNTAIYNEFFCKFFINETKY